MRKKIITLILCISAGVSAQENWGPASYFTTYDWSRFCPHGYCNGVFSPSMASNDSLYFLCIFCWDANRIAYTRYWNGGWTTPELMPYDTGVWHTDAIFFLTLDSTLYLALPTPYYGQTDIWYKRMENGQWTQRQILNDHINTSQSETSPSMPADGSRLYFIRDTTIMYSDKINGEFTEPVALPNVINSSYHETQPRFSPDGDNLYFNRWDGNELNPASMFVSHFNGQWLEPIRLNNNINMEEPIAGCDSIPPYNSSPTFSQSGTKMYFLHFAPFPSECLYFDALMVSNLVTGVDEQNPSLPGEISLSAYPNPFNASVNLAVTGVTDCIIHVYDIAGRGIAEIGIHGGTATWDASNYSSGIYFVRATSENRASQAIKLVYLK